MGDKVVYIAGPMIGHENLNFDSFHDAADRFRSKGWVVINPAENFEGRKDLPRECYIKVDVERLPRCTAIALLPGWENSRGARMEYMIALDCRLKVFDAATTFEIKDKPKADVHLDWV